MSVAFGAGEVSPEGLIFHFNEETDFTLVQIEKLGSDKAPDIEGLDVSMSSQAGEDFDLEASLGKGKVTIIAFYADWCVP